ncbi:hypothetical protein PTKIN_Ptkin15bG0094400 [Pterospermum kingtungense]
MEGYSGVNNAVRKKRSQTSRRPHPAESQDHSPISSTPPSDDVSKASSDENVSADANSRQNHCVEIKKTLKRKKEDGRFSAFCNNEPGRSGSSIKHSSEGVLAPANRKSTSKLKEWSELELESRNVDVYDGRNAEIQSSVQGAVINGDESKVKKVKLKVGGVTSTIHSSSTANGLLMSGSSTRKNNLQGSTDNWRSPPDKRSGLQGVSRRDFSKDGFSFGKEDSLLGKTSGKNNTGKQGDQVGMVRKSKRAPKRCVVDGEFGDDDEDDEIRYLEKRKQRSFRVYEDTDYEGEELVSDSELEDKTKKKQRKQSVDALMESKRKVTLTTRQRALQSSKDASFSPGSSLIEFPNGLPPAPSRKQKENLSEVEQQLKKAEAAQRRRMQVEKANRESEAEAIRKILGQDSSRKKREDKIKKRQEELAQEKAVNAYMLASNTIRLVMGPTGTTITFPRDLGFPSIFHSKPSSYPPPRENCAGPSCANPYKYRDSKLKLPLCSLQCYKAIQEQLPVETTC